MLAARMAAASWHRRRPSRTRSRNVRASARSAPSARGTSGRTPAARGPRPPAADGERLPFAPAHHVVGVHVQSQVPGDGGRGHRMVPGDQPHGHAAVLEFGQQVGRLGSDGVGQAQQSERFESTAAQGFDDVRVLGGPCDRVVGTVRRATAITRRPSSAIARTSSTIASSASGGGTGARGQDHLGGTLDEQFGAVQRRRVGSSGAERQDHVRDRSRHCFLGRLAASTTARSVACAAVRPSGVTDVRAAARTPGRRRTCRPDGSASPEAGPG